MSNLATYITFPGNTADVFTHWHEVLGGELHILRYGDVPPMEMPFSPPAEAVAHVTLSFAGGELAGGDSMDDGPYPIRDTAYSLLYTTDTPEQAREIVERFIAAGGEVGMPFEQAPWGGYYGQVFDRFGVMWAFSCD